MFFIYLGSARAGFLLRALCNWIAHSKHGITARLVNLPLFIRFAFSIPRLLGGKFFCVSGRNFKNKIHAFVIIHYKC